MCWGCIRDVLGVTGDVLLPGPTISSTAMGVVRCMGVLGVYCGPVGGILQVWGYITGV